MLRCEYPCRTVSEANRHEHWRKRHERRKWQRRQAWGRLYTGREGLNETAYWGQLRRRGAIIRLTRIAPRRLDSDNLPVSLKAIRDGVADWLGIDDGDERLTWLYAQTKGEPKQYAVRIEVFGRDEWQAQQSAKDWNDETEAATP